MQSRDYNKIKLIAVLSFLMAAQIPAMAQRFSSEVWHTGQVVLLEGDTLSGRVKYDMESQIVQYSGNGETIQTFSPRKLISFDLYDEVIGAYRIFYILPFEANGNYRTPYIFEVLYTGARISLMRTESVETVVRNTPYIYGGSYSSIEQVYTYYFLKPGGDIKVFSGKKSDLYRIMADRSAEIKGYIKENNMNVDRLTDLIRISSFYNSLQ